MITKIHYMCIERILTLQALMTIVGDDKEQYPILCAVYQIVIENKEPRKIINDLMKKGA